MIRGPLPREAIRDAIGQAAARGTVMDRDLFQRARLGFIIFCMSLTVFVRVRRSRSHILRPEDLAAEFAADIRMMRGIPLTAVIARELWLLAPWGTWQYFRILDDRIIEIRSDGVPLLGFTGPAPADRGPEGNPGESTSGNPGMSPDRGAPGSPAGSPPGDTLSPAPAPSTREDPE